MWFGVGIDLGTSFASAAVGGPGGTHMVSLSPDVVVPSVACPGPDGSLLTGTAALESASDPGLLARGFKRRLGDPSRLVLGGSSFSPGALMAAQLRDTMATVKRVQGGPPGSIVLTCPAIWGPYRREHFAEVPRLAGVSDYHLVTEPEAAATHYANERRLGEGEVVAVYDLGGGTFDTTILRVRAGAMEILGTPEGIEHMGGIDFDETLLANINERLDGAIDELDPEDTEAAAALAAIHQMCVKAKETLSIEPDVTLSVPLPSGPREVVISRLEFNDMIRPSVQLTTDILQRTVTSAGLRPDDVSAVLLAGGSSRIPLVSQMVSREFGRPVRMSMYPKFTVALGAATIAARPEAIRPGASAGTALTKVPAGALNAPSPADAENTATDLVASTAADQPVSKSTDRRSKRRASLVAAGVAVLVTGVVALVLAAQPPVTVGVASSGALSADAPNTSEFSQPPQDSPTSAGASSIIEQPTSRSVERDNPVAGTPEPLTVFDGRAVAPWDVWIGSLSTNWSGTNVGPRQVKDGPLTAQLDGKGGVLARWAGGGPAHLYFQSSPDMSDARDLSRYFEADGAIVFDVVMHEPPTAATTMEVHCGHPCRSTVSAERMFQRLDVGKKSRVTIPLSCFTNDAANEWDPKKINTPWLVYSEGTFSATFSNVRWVPGAGDSSAATSCAALQ